MPSNNDIKNILTKYDAYNRESKKIELKSDIDDKDKWIFDKDSDTFNVSTDYTKFIDIDKYWNHYGTVSPKVDVEFLVGFLKDVEDKDITDEKGHPIKNWVNINYNNDIKNNNYNNYFVSANIVDNGVKELTLVLYDRTFVGIQRLINASINFVGEQTKTTNENTNKDIKSNDNYFSKKVENGIDLEFFTVPDKITSNLRIRYGYNENKNLPVTSDYKGLGKDGLSNTRWKYTEQEEYQKSETGYSIKDDVVMGQYQQCTLFSSWEEFFITGLTSTLTETGIKYTIKAVSSDQFALNGYKMVQQYSNLVGTPKAVMATLMNTFNSSKKSPIKLVWTDDAISSTDSAINGEEILINYENGEYVKVNEKNINDELKKLPKPIEDLTKNVNMLRDILACFNNIPENGLDSYTYGQSVEYNSNIQDAENGFLTSKARISSNKSYLDLIAWPFNLSENKKLNNLSVNSDYSNDIKMMALFQKDIATSYNEILNIVNNKEKGKDSKTEIFIKSLMKIWLANIAIEAYDLNNMELNGKIGSLKKKLEELEQIENNYKNSINQIENYFKEINDALPLRWKYDKFENEDDTEYSKDENYYYFPGTYRDIDGNLKENYIKNDNDNEGISIDDESLCSNSVINNTSSLNAIELRRTANKILNIINRKDINLNNLLDFKVLGIYRNISFTKNKTSKIDDELFDAGFGTLQEKNIATNTTYFFDEVYGSSRNSLHNIVDEYRNCKDIPMVKKYIENYNNILMYFQSIETNLQNIPKKFICDNAINFVKEANSIFSTNIFIEENDRIVLNNFNITKDLICSDPVKEYSLGKTDHYVFTISDGIEGHNIFRVRTWTDPKEHIKYIKKYVKEVLEFALSYKNKSEIFSNSVLYENEIYNKQEEYLSTPDILNEYKKFLNCIKEYLIQKREDLKLGESIKVFAETKSSANDAENDIKKTSTLNNLLNQELATIGASNDENKNKSKKNLNLIKIIDYPIEKEKITESDGKYFGANEHKSDSYNMILIDDSKYKGNYLLDAFTLINGDDYTIENAKNFSECLKKDIQESENKLNALKEKQTKLDSTNIGKEIELSLGSQESRDKDSKLTKTLSSLLSEFCSRCQPKVTQVSLDLKNKNKDTTIQDANQDSKKVDVFKDIPKYNLTWGIVGHYKKDDKDDNSIPIVGLYYKEPKPVKKLRLYNWGTGNPKAHCIKSVSISSSNEFAMMHSFNTITTTGTGIKSNFTADGGNMEIKDFLPTKEPCFFSNSFDNTREENLFNNMVNSIAKGSITILGDPSLKFSGTVQPYTYPIYLNIKLQAENPSWSNSAGSSGMVSPLSGCYMVTKITHDISSSGYTTTLDVMRYPGSGENVILGENGKSAADYKAPEIKATNI